MAPSSGYVMVIMPCANTLTEAAKAQCRKCQFHIFHAITFYVIDKFLNGYKEGLSLYPRSLKVPKKHFFNY